MNYTLEHLRAERAAPWTGYHESESDRPADAAKEMSRQLVLNHFLKHHESPDGWARMFCLPGMYWHFERQLANSIPTMEFVGIERNPKVFQKSVAWMPHATTRARHLTRDYGSGEHVDYVERGHLHCARLICNEASTFLRKRRVQSGLTREEKSQWTGAFRMYSCAWFDFTSQLCSEIEVCLQELPGAINCRCKTIPVAVTILKARESQDIQNKMFALGVDRVGFVQRYLTTPTGTCEIDDTFEYTSSHGSPMLLILGRLIPSVVRPKNNKLLLAAWRV